VEAALDSLDHIGIETVEEHVYSYGPIDGAYLKFMYTYVYMGYLKFMYSHVYMGIAWNRGMHVYI